MATRCVGVRAGDSGCGLAVTVLAARVARGDFDVALGMTSFAASAFTRGG